MESPLLVVWVPGFSELALLLKLDIGGPTEQLISVMTGLSLYNVSSGGGGAQGNPLSLSIVRATKFLGLNFGGCRSQTISISITCYYSLELSMTLYSSI